MSFTLPPASRGCHLILKTNNCLLLPPSRDALLPLHGALIFFYVDIRRYQYKNYDDGTSSYQNINLNCAIETWNNGTVRHFDDFSKKTFCAFAIIIFSLHRKHNLNRQLSNNPHQIKSQWQELNKPHVNQQEEKHLANR